MEERESVRAGKLLENDSLISSQFAQYDIPRGALWIGAGASGPVVRIWAILPTAGRAATRRSASPAKDVLSYRQSTMSVELIADAIGVPVWALVPVALAAAAVLVFILDGLSHSVLKPGKSPPVIGTTPVFGGMLEFLKGPIGLMARAYPKYGEAFTGESRPHPSPFRRDRGSR